VVPAGLGGADGLAAGMVAVRVADVAGGGGSALVVGRCGRVSGWCFVIELSVSAASWR